MLFFHTLIIIVVPILVEIVYAAGVDVNIAAVLNAVPGLEFDLIYRFAVIVVKFAFDLKHIISRDPCFFKCLAQRLIAGENGIGRRGIF